MDLESDDEDKENGIDAMIVSNEDEELDEKERSHCMEELWEGGKSYNITKWWYFSLDSFFLSKYYLLFFLLVSFITALMRIRIITDRQVKELLFFIVMVSF